MRGMKSHTARLRTLCLMVATAGLWPPCCIAGSSSPRIQHRDRHLSRDLRTGRRRKLAAETGTANTIADDEGSSTSSQVGHFVAAIPSSAYQLTEIEGRLRSSGAYVPIAHAAWSQTASGWGTRAGFPVQRLGVDVPGLSGTVFLERGQYLHLGMTLTYADPSPPSGLGAASGTMFTINQSRRIKFYERNYYDHPAFGRSRWFHRARHATAGTLTDLYWKSADSAVEILFFPNDFARFNEARQAFNNASKESSRGGTKLATPALNVTKRPDPARG